MFSTNWISKLFFRIVHFKIGTSSDSIQALRSPKFIRTNSPWPPPLDVTPPVTSSSTTMTSALFLSASPNHDSSLFPTLHRDKSEPSMFTVSGNRESAHFQHQRRSFSCQRDKPDFNDISLMASKSRSFSQSSFTITTNPMETSRQVTIQLMRQNLITFVDLLLFSVKHGTFSKY